MELNAHPRVRFIILLLLFSEFRAFEQGRIVNLPKPIFSASGEESCVQFEVQNCKRV